MGVDNIKIGGMDRLSNATDAPIGSCEELINIASEGNNLKIDGRKKAISANIQFKQIHIHDIAQQRNYIGRSDDGIVLFDLKTGSVIQTIHSVSSGNDVHIASLNNMLVISDKTVIKTYVYLWDKTTYKTFYSGIGSVNMPFNVVLSTTAWTEEGESHYPDYDHYDEGATERLISSIASYNNQFKAKNRYYAEGFILMAFNLTLFDNSEVLLNKFIPIIPEAAVDGTTIDNTFVGCSYNNTFKVTMNYKNLYNKYTLSLSAVASQLAQYKDVVKAVNLYVSNPISNIDITIGGYAGDTPNNDSINGFIPFYTLGTKKAGLEKTLLYKRKSWTLDELKESVVYDVEFGLDSVTTGKTLEVDNSWVERAGRMMVYNRRVHFFDSVTRTNLSDISFNPQNVTDLTPISATAYVYIRTATKDVIIQKSNLTLYTEEGNLRLNPMLIIPDSRAYKVVIQSGGYAAEIALSSSPAYNYAYAFTTDSIPLSMAAADITPDAVYDESNVINVTAVDNPIFFPVEHSYAFNGNIIDIGIATEQISESQIGMYPVNVFTDKGIYALEQGSGVVLYSNIIPINTDVCTGDVLPTRNGLVYISNNHIYLLYGRRNLCLTTVLDGEIDFDIRNNNSYVLCCNRDNTYNITENLSNIRFKEYLKGAGLAYSPEFDELIVSNFTYKYSYIFSFIHKTWHKSTELYTMVGNNLLLRPVMENQSAKKAAVGRVRITNLIAQQAKQIQSAAYAEFTSDGAYYMSYSCNAGDKMALVVANQQVASAQFPYKTNIAIIAAVLCRDLDYLEDYCEGNTLTIYSTDSTIAQGQDYIEIHNLTTGHKITNQFVNKAENVEIPVKGIDYVPGVYINGYGGRAHVGSNGSIVIIADEIADTFNANPDVNTIAVAEAVGNEIKVTALEEGAAGNSLNLTAGGDVAGYIQFEVDQMSGGKDVTKEPSDYSEIVDYSQEEDSTRIIHIQTRPFSLGNKNAYTSLQRVVLNVKASLANDSMLSFYIFASNNLTDWKCVAGSQKKKCLLSSIRLNRVARSYKWFVVIIGGQVKSTTNISNIVMESDLIGANKIR